MLDFSFLGFLGVRLEMSGFGGVGFWFIWDLSLAFIGIL